tara:strand:- start:177 stop:302 length:126 start_codon:yes stop_codon:yes gene_type:complete
MIEVIQSVIERYKDKQVNLASESVRWRLALEISEELGKYIK